LNERNNGVIIDRGTKILTVRWLRKRGR